MIALLAHMTGVIVMLALHQAAQLLLFMLIISIIHPCMDIIVQDLVVGLTVQIVLLWKFQVIVAHLSGTIIGMLNLI